jgi:uncharacterized protein
VLERKRPVASTSTGHIGPLPLDEGADLPASKPAAMESSAKIRDRFLVAFAQHDRPRSPTMPKPLRVAISAEHSVGAVLYPAIAQDQAGSTLILGHGAGAGQASAFMVQFATGLAARGIDVVTFNFYYTEQGRRVPDPNSRLEACYLAVIERIAGLAEISRNRLAIGGKSMGGRIASQIAADGAKDVVGLVFLGYPLHPPGKPEQLRARHLARIKAPMLFVQGSRDVFGTPAELRPIIDTLPARVELYVVDGGDHSFTVPRKAGVTQRDAYEAILDHIARWLRRRPPGSI